MTLEPPSLLERSVELDLLRGAARDTGAGRGRLVAIQGSAGLGKTTMLGAAARFSQREGLRVLAARGTPLEQLVGFGVARQLLRDLAGEVNTGDPGSPLRAVAVRAAAGPLGIATAAPIGPVDPLDAELAIVELVQELARCEPLTLIVDDAQWADEPSLRVLARLASRHDALAVMVVVAMRPPTEQGGAVGTGELLRAPSVGVLSLAPLSDAAAADLVRSVTVDASEQECSACQSASRGNPLWLRELATALRAPPTSGTQRVPPSIAAAVNRRLTTLSDAACRLAQAVAIFEPRATLARSASLAAMDWDVAVAAADELIAAAVLEHGAELVFAHPVVRAAVQDAIPPVRRADLHRAAARLLDADGVELDAVAVHLLQSLPRGDRRVADQLAAAAQAATERGAPEEAIACLRRAVEEPPPSGRRRAELRLALGHAEMLIGAMAESEADLRRALAGVGGTAPALRLQTAMGLAQVLSSGDRLTEGVALLDAELSRAAAVDDDLRARAETVLLNAARMDAAAHAAASPRADRLRRVVLNGGDATPEQLAAVAASEAQAGISAQRTAEIGVRALEQMGARPELDTLSYGHAARALVAADRLNEATAALDRGLEISRRRGVRFTAVFLVAILAEARYRAGALADAERLMREALASDAQWGIGRPAMLSVLIRALLDQGRTEAAGELAVGMMLDAATAAPVHRYPRIMGLHARGRWRLAAGDAAGALLDYERCATGLVACAEPNPALIEWRSDAAWALLALGNRDRSQALADEELALARNYGAARPIGIALRARAAAGSPTERITLLREAVVTLRHSPSRLVRAQVLIDLGLALQRGAEAREHLTAALELADACGAQPLVRRARRALSRTGARPRRSARSGPASLTAAERRVADLAAAGHTNPAIAARLVVTVRTVELHLTNTYRKLGISSRVALTRALSSQAE